MDFDEFQKLNERRCNEAFKPCATWGIQEFGLAIAGEAGELCNLIKKIIRGDYTFDEKRDELAKEVADVITYCDLFNTRIGVSTGPSLMAKFEEVSKRVNWGG